MPRTEHDATVLPLALPARRVMGWPELASLCIALATLILLVVGSIWLVQRTGAALSDALRLEQQRRTGRQLLIEIDAAETGQRGYLLTGRDVYLKPYEDARGQIPSLMALLDKEAASGTPAERDLLTQMRAAAEGKLAELAQTVAYLRAGDTEAAMALVQTDQGERLMARLRTLTEAFGRDQAVLVQTQVHLVQSRGLVLVWLEIAGLAVVLLMAGMIGLGIRSYLRAMRVASLALSRSNEQLAGANHGLDEQVRARTADLQSANDEIQRFAYIVSHDLRAPLVNIMGFTSELEQATARLREHVAAGEAAPDVLEAAESDIPEAIGFIKTSTAKMDRLINAILRLSREGRRVLAAERLDMAAMCREIVDSLRHQAIEKGVEIEVGEMPNLVGDRVAIEQVFGNVIDNALKYLRPDRPGRVRIRGRVEDGMALFDIADNGRGIAPRDYERVFELFRRAGDQTVPGEGIGLAHVRALVRRLGGSIICESELDAGTTFIIRLPFVAADAKDIAA